MPAKAAAGAGATNLHFSIEFVYEKNISNNGGIICLTAGILPAKRQYSISKQEITDR